MTETNSSNARDYDLVVCGATGFTGRLVVEYLASTGAVGGSLRWAVAGRDRERLERVVEECVGTTPRPDVLVVDSLDDDAVNRLAASTAVVLTTIGPYARYGEPLLRACVENGTHYCDLCGEVQWMRRMIDSYQAAAAKSGACIVLSCGFDSIPSDLGVQFLQETSQERHGAVCERIRLYVRALRGGASGGTFASMLNAIREARADRNVARVLGDPYALNPEGTRDGPDGRELSDARFDDEVGEWTGPFVMAAVNTRVVRRSNALLGYPYGRDFRYGEVTLFGSGPGGWWRAKRTSWGLKLFVMCAAIELTRPLVVKRLPKPGEGPSAEQREKGFFKLRLLGVTPDGDRVRVRVTGDRDPGYGSTSKMLAESALCLVSNRDKLSGGLHTPASALGAELRSRLVANAGLTFDAE